MVLHHTLVVEQLVLHKVVELVEEDNADLYLEKEELRMVVEVEELHRMSFEVEGKDLHHKVAVEQEQEDSHHSFVVEVGMLVDHKVIAVEEDLEDLVDN